MQPSRRRTAEPVFSDALLKDPPEDLWTAAPPGEIREVQEKHAAEKPAEGVALEVLGVELWCVWRLDEVSGQMQPRVWLPAAGAALPVKLKIAAYFHCSLRGGGHKGRKTTEVKCRQFFAWLGLGKFVRRLVQKCKVCLAVRPRPCLRSDARRSIYLGLWKTMFIDYCGPFSPSRGEGGITYRYILTVIDGASGWCWIIATPDSTAATAATKFYELVCCDVGRPAVLRSDRGTEFLAHVWDHLLQKLGIRRQLGNAFNATSQSHGESPHNPMMSVLRSYVMKITKNAKWHELCPPAQWLGRSAPQERFAWASGSLDLEVCLGKRVLRNRGWGIAVVQGTRSAVIRGASALRREERSVVDKS